MLIGLHGKKQAGKDTVHQRIEKLLGPGSKTGATVDRVSFADLLYESAAAALGGEADQLRVWKNDPNLRIEIGEWRTDSWGESYFAPLETAGTIREYLQRYGTEGHRRMFGDDFWVDNVDLKDHDRKIVVVTDVRFRNEAQAVVDAGGSVVHVIGPPDVEGAGDGHASEEPLPAYLVDYVLDNTERDDGFRALDERVLDLALGLLREAA